METVVNRGFRGEVQEEVDLYNLDAIIAVGYRISSARATKFRQWATKVLTEYIKKGFVLDENRLKQGNAVFGKDYFRELLEKVRSIRASERRIWQQITDIYAECSFDYDRNSPTTREFYQMVQNRFHYAITGQTAPEIIYTRADHTKDHMGLQTWKSFSYICITFLSYQSRSLFNELGMFCQTFYRYTWRFRGFDFSRNQ